MHARYSMPTELLANSYILAVGMRIEPQGKLLFPTISLGVSHDFGKLGTPKKINHLKEAFLNVACDWLFNTQ